GRRRLDSRCAQPRHCLTGLAHEPRTLGASPAKGGTKKHPEKQDLGCSRQTNPQSYGTIERESRCHVQSDNFSDTPCVNDQTHGLWAGNPCATGENDEQFSQAVPNGEFEWIFYECPGPPHYSWGQSKASLHKCNIHPDHRDPYSIIPSHRFGWEFVPERRVSSFL
ncbi:hypothetical protein PoMZ_06134, partial [Pyricularia oryzae]